MRKQASLDFFYIDVSKTIVYIWSHSGAKAKKTPVSSMVGTGGGINLRAMWIHWIGIALPESVGTRGGINLRGRFIFGIALPVSVSGWIRVAGVVSALIVVRPCDLTIVGPGRIRLIVVTSVILVTGTVVSGVEDGRVGFSIAFTFYGCLDLRGGINLRGRGIWIGIALPESVVTRGSINLRGRPRVCRFFVPRGGISQSGE